MTIYQWLGVMLITGFLVVSCDSQGCTTDTECGCVADCLGSLAER